MICFQTTGTSLTGWAEIPGNQTAVCVVTRDNIPMVVEIKENLAVSYVLDINPSSAAVLLGPSDQDTLPLLVRRPNDAGAQTHA